MTAPPRGSPAADDLARLAELGLRAAELVHEIRQPIFALKGSLQLSIAEGLPLEPDQLRALLLHLAQLEQLVDRVALAARRPHPEPQPLALGPVVRAVVESLRARARAARKELTLTVTEAQISLADPVVVYQATQNLLLNAIHAASSEVRVLVRSGEIQVEDDGAGVPTEVVLRVFEPFFTTKAPGEGTGLGLSISRSQLEALGGSLELAPTGGGARFVVRVPVLPD